MDPKASPLVLVVCGLPGAGKTRLAIALSQRLGLARLSRDELCWPRRQPELAPGEAKRLAFDVLLERLAGLLRDGRDAVVEGMPFSRRREHAAVAAVADRCDATVCTLWLDCPPELARRRIAVDRDAGGHPAPDRSPALVAAVAARWEPPPGDAHRLDASQPAERVLDQALETLRSRLRRT